MVIWGMVSYCFTHMIHNVVNPIINNPQNLVIIGCLLLGVPRSLGGRHDTLYHGWFMGIFFSCVAHEYLTDLWTDKKD